MLTIHKYPLPTAGLEFCLNLPVGAAFQAAQVQHGRPVAWFTCDVGAPPVQREFKWATTGGACPDNPEWLYVTTLQIPEVDTGEQNLVLHLFVRNWFPGDNDDDA